ncbi:MAG TPA: hypothetical protein VK195_10550 [Burkholderiaceae bacterium]|nr:hypothetical protein [Burkholderiaceae bacterium]
MQGFLYFIEPLPEKQQGMVPLEGKYLLRALHRQIETNGSVLTEKAVLFKCFAGTQRTTFLLWVNEAQGPQAFGIARSWSAAQTQPEEAGRFTWEHLTPPATPQQAWTAVSHFLRGSTTLPPAALEAHDALHLVVDAKGTAVFCPHPAGDRGARLLAAYVLALAYLRVLEQCSDELADLTRTADAQRRAGQLKPGDMQVQELYRTYCTFLASSYFDEPVRKVSTEVGPVYASFRRALQLDGWRDDLSDRMHKTAQLLDAEQERQEAGFESRTQRRLSWLAIGIAVIGLLQVAQTTPAQVSGFLGAWTRCLSDGWKACTVEAPKAEVPQQKDAEAARKPAAAATAGKAREPGKPPSR